MNQFAFTIVWGILFAGVVAAYLHFDARRTQKRRARQLAAYIQKTVEDGDRAA